MNISVKSQFPSLLISIPKGVLDLGWGHPSPRLHPNKILKTAADKVLSKDSVPLQYGAIQGFGPLLESLTTFLSDDDSYRNCLLTPEHLFLTSGASQAIDFASTLFAEGGDTVFVEDPTYYLISSIFRDHRMNIIGVPTDHLGLNVDALEAMLSDNSIAKPKLLYTMPSFQNPTGAVMPLFRRKRLIELARTYDFLILADEVYQLLSFEDKYNPPLPLHYYGGYTYSISSFSKILAPSLRLGWIQASEKLLELLLNCGQLDSSGGINPFISRIVHNIIEDGYLDKYLDETRDRLNQRCQVLCDNLTSFNFIKPNGGYFLWIKLPINSIKFLEYCKNERIKFHTGNKFSNDGNKQEFIRLSFSFYDLDGLKIGSERLTKCYNNYLIQNNNINVTINGCTGRLGSKIKHYVNTSHNMNMHSGLNSEVTEFIPSGINDIIVDVSKPEGTRNLLQYLLKNNLRIPILIGTTGDLPYDMIKLYCEVAPVAIISNFSYGIPLLINLLKSVNTQNWNVRNTPQT